MLKPLGERIAEYLREELGPKLPEGFSLLPNGSELNLFYKDEWISAVILEGMTGDPDTVAARIWSALSGVQDDVCLRLKEPWPVVSDRQGEREMAQPQVSIENSTRLRLYFGPSENPVIELPSLEIGE